MADADAPSDAASSNASGEAPPDTADRGTEAPDPTLPAEWGRAVITSVRPTVDGGRWPIKRVVGEPVQVEAGVVVDGHEKLRVELVHRPPDATRDHVEAMTPQGNDVYTARFVPSTLGRHVYRVRAWIDRFATWQDQFRRRIEGGESEQELMSELQEGAGLLREATARAEGDDHAIMAAHLDAFDDGDFAAALRPEVATLVRRYAEPSRVTRGDTYEVLVDPERARSGAWYEFFPRSAPSDEEHATLDDAAELLPRIADMGFDIVYLPPIHPIGETNRKGKDNTPVAEPGDPGSPWAIGGDAGDGTAGGHKSVHPKLGGIEAFDRFVERADELGLDVALDIAFQTSPDHPYVEAHPEWYNHRPDGSIRYAENPPKKYEDVYPLNFETDDWPALWTELKSVFEFWIEHGVTTFRVDNPHTKSFAFWEWCLKRLRAETPELVVLAEAFTRPKTMYTLAKLGFNTSYTYFTWRNTRDELEAYGRELFHTDTAEFFRPNFWPNTPDILHDDLVYGGRAAHQARFVLAATLSSTYGVYGPPFEHVENTPHPDREEYANNEKYEIRSWDWHDPTSLQPFMQRVNEIRDANPALRQMRSILFHETHNDHLIAYSKKQGDNLILVVVNLDPHHAREGVVELPLDAIGLPRDANYQVHDLLNDARYTWRGPQNYVRLDPHDVPAHIFRVQLPSDAADHPTYTRPVHD
jgi:starch synthase (maltosyl-transferring)